ncbi:NADH:ubiquinone oxidoreductase subunit F (NADH-binding) [Mycolicibacterium iranicum]|uniref:NADH:ubiquinone oxidoreductase subunit F (NADH-binding) n=1 Tax=Mycolicibacterium iranicum TaxID=912594 RepID=A0A839Q8M9_MYCIR|nr:NADH-ubiquinone oxidoreductase-F iron-sulfur binding region domain-containing protein [Mycolicibacterium iranicum]MBB2991843.1 NADH:ubiquinone oxidoreductase subunit F (NADH-binding) [Mycolicibacterium iranicum]
MSTAMNTELTVTIWPGLTPRLLRTGDGVESVADYLAAGGYRPQSDDESFLAEIGRAGLVGRGGAAFPMAVKLTTVRTASLRGQDTVLVANGEEGEPASVKDRWLLRHRPHLVLDGVRLAARIIGARHAHIYVSDVTSAQVVQSALDDVAPESLDGITVGVFTVAPGYVAGEESAAVRAINGGPAKPTDKPPRPFEEGVGGLPTVVSNVETLANLPFIHLHGAATYREVGTDASPGTFLATITGGGRPPGLYEVPLGASAAELIELHGISTDQVHGALMGGYFAGLLDRRIVDGTMDHESLRALGSGLGCGAVSVITDECPIAVAASVLDYYDRENADQCGSCFNGTAAMAAAAGALRDGVADADDVARLQRWSMVLRGRGACATLDAACNIAASMLAMFPDHVARHLDDQCPSCRRGAFTAQRPFEVEAL